MQTILYFCTNYAVKDTTKHFGLRKKLAESLKNKGIEDVRILKAIESIPRHLFLDSSFEAHAYQDKAFPIGAEQTISQPFTVAFQTQLLQLLETDRVLEIGTGSGYQTAVLLEMKTEVYSIERQHELFRNAKRMLPKLGYHSVSLFFGDGYKGLPEKAPFDKIIVTAGAPEVPKTLLSQLKIGGRMVVPLGVDTQVMTLYIRTGIASFDKQTFGDFRFVPMLGDRN
jgi:protein-L-isoaspartate(D-aspartate) O-methyltransferase